MRTMGRNEYKSLLMQHAKQKHHLRYVAIEILDSCVYKCPHCYVKDKYKAMMSVTDYCRIIDQIYKSGCIWLLLTGGEPLLHPDFIYMYKYAYSKGFKVTVFSNGYLVNQEIIDCFKEFPPEIVELTIYGGSHKAYDDYVGISGAYEVFDHAIDKLLDSGVRTKAKSVLMSSTLDEMEVIDAYVKKKGIEFRYDGFVVPKIDGDMKPCSCFRLPPEIVFEMDKKKPGFIEAQMEKQKQYIKKMDKNNLYSCDAGYNSVFVDASCQMSICTFARHLNITLSENVSVKEGQEILIGLMNSKKPLDENDKCFNCEKKAFCRYCPGQFLLENGDEYEPIQWHCNYAQLVLDTINERKMKENENN